MANPALPHRQTWRSLADLAFVCCLSAAAAGLLWTKLHTLPWMDPAWWLQEMARYAHGQAPYRDYYWPYPPLAVFLFGTALRWFGQKFWVAQVLVDLFSLAVMLGIYYWTRRLLPQRLHALNCLLVLAVCATTQTYFSLFSFLTYGPVLHVSAAGLLLFGLGALRLTEDPGEGRALFYTAAGAFLALTSKQESLFAVCAVFVLLSLWRRRITPGWLAYSARLAVLWFLPAACVYVIFGLWAGFGNMLLAIQGNGLTRLACPWWPTGFALLVDGAALGLALAVGGLATLADAARWRAYLGGMRYAGLLAAALAGAVIYCVFVAVSYPDSVFGPAPAAQKLAALAPELLSTSAIFRPVLWTMIVWWLYLLVRLHRAGPKASAASMSLLLVVTIPVSLGVRSLFGSYLTPMPEVPAICYPFAVVLTGYLLLRWLSLPYGRTAELQVEAPLRPLCVTAALMLAYVAVRLAGGYSGILSDRQFTRIETPAGSVKVREGTVNREIVDYVLAETRPEDPILEIPYGGGVSFATGRPSFSFTTLWRQGVVPEALQAADLRDLMTHPPRVIIASQMENFGSYYGMMGTNACPFPELVWKPHGLSWRPGYVYPAIRWIQANYRADRRVGDWLLLRPAQGPDAKTTSTQ